jgi:hypothetical protein
VAADVEPPELAALLDVAERPRTNDWSLRAALTRYAQGEPERVGALLEVVRWVEFALRPHLKAIRKDGPGTWAALQGGGDAPGVEYLRLLQELDRLGDVLAVWADDPWQAPRPDAEVDAAIRSLAAQLTALGAPREERVRPPRARG